MKRLRNIHPGEISAIVKGTRSVTADTTLRFAKYFGTTAKFWLGIQGDFDIEEESKKLKRQLNFIPNISGNAA